ncbi:MAG: radical SAM protein, partial [Mesorhizobium sp.]
INPSGRFEPVSRHVFDDGWNSLEELPPFKTEVQVEKPRTIITRNESPDISFDRSINPYRGCEHGCVYCFARPTHSFM